MAHSTLSSTEKAALLDLIDDPSPTVRRSLCQHFNALGVTARDFLQNTASGTNRHLAWHARSFLEELNFTDPVGEFREFIKSLNYELETGALLLARTVRPHLDAGACCEELDRIAARCRELMVEPSTTRAKCRVINRVIYHELGYRGNVEHYTDPDNSFLDQVLRNRRGIPISMCMLYLLVAQRVGLDLEPIGLPGHFMIGCFTDDAPFFIDAFDRGIFRSPEEIFVFLRSHDMSPRLSDLAPTPIREILCRSCRNLANHYESHGHQDRAQLFDSFVTDFETTYSKHTT
ncbi:transglutaminase-like domain-containing protein [Synoicihabitans lomoniglobus]|uniref:Transglutaminase-like domain-containing protein n=1 Tax=Synoicihabitans lomoniglobus TaxID=2909285 RepID=A0AAF0CN49_9BACT|nr:transglutaminase-like domain-containing protein [Opitutaceae bacterium LMO-M01]WED63965.1 transglutaminase-like domain-containing protein [Opitutaceae bacterium LMO-M01]